MRCRKYREDSTVRVILDSDCTEIVHVSKLTSKFLRLLIKNQFGKSETQV